MKGFLSKTKKKRTALVAVVRGAEPTDAAKVEICGPGDVIDVGLK